MISSFTDETLGGISFNWFDRISAELRPGKYIFSSSNKVCILKLGKQEKRLLNIGLLRDKIVQKALQLVLEPIFEPHFFDNSHGFRFGRDCHASLKTIKKQFHGVT